MSQWEVIEDFRQNCAGWSSRELKDFIQSKGISIDGLYEKTELVERAALIKDAELRMSSAQASEAAGGDRLEDLMRITLDNPESANPVAQLQTSLTKCGLDDSLITVVLELATLLPSLNETHPKCQMSIRDSLMTAAARIDTVENWRDAVEGLKKTLETSLMSGDGCNEEAATAICRFTLCITLASCISIAVYCL